MKPLLPLLSAIAILLATATVAAQVYKWVDKDGKVQYSDVPPPSDVKGVVPKKIDMRVTSPAQAGNAGTVALPNAASKTGADAKAAKDAPKTLADKSKDFEKRRTDEAEAQKKSTATERIAKADQARCTEATRFLGELDSGRPMSASNDKGERVILDESGRAAQVERARKAMTESCRN